MDNDPQNTPQPQFNAPEPIQPMSPEPAPVTPTEPAIPPTFPTEPAPMQPPKKSKKTLIIVIVLVTLIISASIAGLVVFWINLTVVSKVTIEKPSPTPAVVVTEKPKLEPEVVSIAKGGKATVSNGDIELSVNSVIRNIPRTQSWLQDNELMAVNITIKNIIENSRMFYDNALKLLADGVEYRTTSHYDEAYKPYFEGSITGGGRTHEGNIFFDIPKGATDLKLQYQSEEYDTDLEADKTVIYRIDF